MTWQTHREYSVAFALIVPMIMYHFSLLDLMNYHIATIIIVQFAKEGAKFPDVDHHWDNVKEKTFVNLIINKIIHITGGKHRSWQTHSIDITATCLLISIVVPKNFLVLKIITSETYVLYSTVLIGFMCGWISHIFSDMLTSAGVRLLCWRKEKVKFVPKKIGNFRFNTGHEWEDFNYKCMKMINIPLLFICLLYPVITNTKVIALVSSVFN